MERFRSNDRLLHPSFIHHNHAISGRFQGGFGAVSGQFQCSFSVVSGRFQGGFRAVSGQYLGYSGVNPVQFQISARHTQLVPHIDTLEIDNQSRLSAIPVRSDLSYSFEIAGAFSTGRETTPV